MSTADASPSGGLTQQTSSGDGVYQVSGEYYGQVKEKLGEIDLTGEQICAATNKSQEEEEETLLEAQMYDTAELEEVLRAGELKKIKNEQYRLLIERTFPLTKSRTKARLYESMSSCMSANTLNFKRLLKLDCL